MNVETGAEAAQFPGKEFINGIAVAVRYSRTVNTVVHCVLQMTEVSNTNVNSLCTTKK